MGDFDECILLRPDSALAQAQKCFALVSRNARERPQLTWRRLLLRNAPLPQYRQAYTGNNPSQVQTAMDGFEDVIRRFAKCAEGYALYAQVRTPLLDSR